MRKTFPMTGMKKDSYSTKAKKTAPGGKDQSKPKASSGKKADQPATAQKQPSAFTNPTSVMAGKGNCRFVA